jgi:hypothetical protein
MANDTRTFKCTRSFAGSGVRIEILGVPFVILVLLFSFAPVQATP